MKCCYADNNLLTCLNDSFDVLPPQSINKLMLLLHWCIGAERGFVRRSIYVSVLAFLFIFIRLGAQSCRTYNILADSSYSWFSFYRYFGKCLKKNIFCLHPKSSVVGMVHFCLLYLSISWFFTRLSLFQNKIFKSSCSKLFEYI